MRKIAKDETFSTTVEIKGKTAICNFAVKPSEASADRFAIASTFNFSKVSDAELLELATQTVRIAVQRQFRTAYLGSDAKKRSEALSDATWSNYDVKSRLIDVERTRGPIDPANAIRKNAAKLTAGELKKLIAELQAGAAK